jgi:hypothetical protein
VTSSLSEYLGSDWPGCAQVFRLTRVRRTGEKVETEVVMGITSLPRERAGAKKLLALTRGHWGIENPQSEDRRCDNLCVAGPARYHRHGGPARAGRVVRPASGPRSRFMLIEGSDRVPPRPWLSR